MPHRTVRSVIEGQNLLTAPPETTVSDAAGLMKLSKVGAIMVVARGKSRASSPSATHSSA